jgi:RNA polymerase sigma factor (sigma-70 family)
VSIPPRSPSDPRWVRIPQFTEQYEEIRRQVRIYIRQKFRTSVDIDEITDATMEKLWQHWPEIDNHLAWAITTAKRHACTESGRRSREQAANDGIADDAGSWPRSSPAGITDQQRVNDLFHALETLSVIQQKVVILAAAGLSNAEIAEFLRSTKNSVAHHLYEGRRKLREILSHHRPKQRRFRRSRPSPQQG